MRATGILHLTTFHEMAARTDQEIRRRRVATPLRKDRPLIVPDPELGWRLGDNVTANLEGDTHYEHRRIRTNPDGLYDAPVDPRKRKVFLLGDSMIEGLSVPHDAHVARHLERRFLDVDVLNLGVSGYSNVQSYVRLRQALKKWQPDLILFAVYFGNDFTENSFESNFTMLGLPGYRRDWIPFWENGRVFRAAENGWNRRLMDLQIYLLAREFFRPTEGQASLGIVQEVVIAAAEAAEDRGVPFVALLIPHDPMVTGESSSFLEERLRQFCSARGIDVISLLEAFRKTGRPTMGYAAPDGAVIDGHWNSGTHRLVADVIARHIADKGYLQETYSVRSSVR